MTNRERFCTWYDGGAVDRRPHWEIPAIEPATVDAWQASGELAPGDDLAVVLGLDPRPTIGAGLGPAAMALTGYPTDTPRSVRTHEEWKGLKRHLNPLEHDYGTLPALGAESRTSDEPWGLTLVGLYAFWRNFLGEAALTEAIPDRAETLHDMARKWLENLCIGTREVLVNSRIDYVVFHEGPLPTAGPLLQAEMVAEFLEPYYADILTHVTALGPRRILLAAEGNAEMLAHYVALGFNGLAVSGDALDLPAFRAAHPGVVLWGGLDARALTTSRDAIARTAAQATALQQAGGYLPALNHPLPPCRLEDVKYLLQLVRG